MTFGVMAAWTKRLNEVRNIKDGYIRGQRMRNLWSDFLEAYGWGEGIRNSNDWFLQVLYRTLEQENFLHV